jgi:hypothetical protein
MSESFELGPVNEDGTRTMTVLGVAFQISAQSLPDETWAIKLQAKADAWAKSLLALND